MGGSKWEQRRVETTQRLQHCALELTLERGFDGWTMDDLAAAADVSRRTVFNYFDAKADVVLGPHHDLPEETVAVFVSGGPTGRLFDDLVQLAREVLHETSVDIELELLRRRVESTDPKVMAIFRARFEEHVEDAVALILEREGEGFGAHRARLVMRLLVTVFDSMLDRSAPDLTRPLPDLIDDAVRDARDVFAD